MEKKNHMLVFLFVLTIVITGFGAAKNGVNTNLSNYSMSDLGKISKNYVCILNSKGKSIEYSSPAFFINQNTISKKENNKGNKPKTLVLGY